MDFQFVIQTDITDQGDDGSSTDDSSEWEGDDTSQNPSHKDDAKSKRNLNDWLKLGGILGRESGTTHFENVNQKPEIATSDSVQPADRVIITKSSNLSTPSTSGPSVQPAEDPHPPRLNGAKLTGNFTSSEKPKYPDKVKNETDQNQTPNKKNVAKKTLKDLLAEKRAQRALESRPTLHQFPESSQKGRGSPEVSPGRSHNSQPTQEQSSFSPEPETKYLNEYHEAAKRSLERRLNKLTIQEFFENDWQGISNSVQRDLDSQFRLTLGEFNVHRDELFKKTSNSLGQLWTFLKDQVVDPFEKDCFQKFICMTNQQFLKISSKFQENLHDKIFAQFADDHHTLELIGLKVSQFVSEWQKRNEMIVGIEVGIVKEALEAACTYYNNEMSKVVGSAYCDPIKLEDYSKSIAKETEGILWEACEFKNDEWTKQFGTSLRGQLNDRLVKFKRINNEKKLATDENLSKLVQVAKETYNEAIKQSLLDLGVKSSSSNLSQFFDQVENSARREALLIFDREGKAYEKNLVEDYRSKLIRLIDSTREFKRDLVDSEDKSCATIRLQLDEEEMERKRSESEFQRGIEWRRTLRDSLKSIHRQFTQFTSQFTPFTNHLQPNQNGIRGVVLEPIPKRLPRLPAIPTIRSHSQPFPHHFQPSPHHSQPFPVTYLTSPLCFLRPLTSFASFAAAAGKQT